MSNRERRSVSLGRHRDRGSRDQVKPPEEDFSTRHNISNFLLTLQRVQASEEENRQLRKENQLLRQRTRSSRLSSSSFRERPTYDTLEQTILPDEEDKIIAADVKRHSLMFVGDSIPPSPEHAALEAQYKKLQEDFEMVKEFLKHLFQHALTISSNDVRSPYKDGRDKCDVNTYNPAHSKQLEHSLQDIHGQINQIRNSQDRQQLKMEQVQKALDNVLCQSSVRNDVTMRIVRQQDKMRELTRHASFLEAQLLVKAISLRQAEEQTRRVALVGQTMETLIGTNSKNLKGSSREEFHKVTEQIHQLGRPTDTCTCKMQTVQQLISHVTAATNQGQTLNDTKPPADVIDAMSKLERLVGSDWHRLGRMLGLNSDCLDDIGKFTNFDLTSRVEKVMMTWVKLNKGASAEGLRQGLDKMDRDVLLIAEQPMCKDWVQLPPEVTTYCIAHLVDAPSIINSLASQGVIGQDSRAFILNASQEHRRAGRLLQSVVYMGVQSLLLLIAALDRHNQSVVANKIRSSLPIHYITTESKLPPSAPEDNSKSHRHSSNFSTPRSASKDTVQNKTPLKTSTHDGMKSNEKQPRKKRSRSLFSRKNKLRDSELDSEIAVDMQGDYNYYYPAINLNALNTTTSSGSGSVGSNERREDSHYEVPSRRQYGRTNHHGSRAPQASEEVIV